MRTNPGKIYRYSDWSILVGFSDSILIGCGSAMESPIGKFHVFGQMLYTSTMYTSIFAHRFVSRFNYLGNGNDVLCLGSVHVVPPV
jgi:hypothetical protein